MITQAPNYRGYRFSADIIGHAVWLYYRFGIGFRDVEDVLAQRGVAVTYEIVRQWCLRFGSVYARKLRHRRSRMGDTWFLDEMFVSISGALTGRDILLTVKLLAYAGGTQRTRARCPLSRHASPPATRQTHEIGGGDG